MVKFTCRIEENNYEFQTTSVIKLERFLINSNPQSTFLFSIESEKNIDFIERFQPTEQLRNLCSITCEKPRKVEFTMKLGETVDMAEYKRVVHWLICQITIMLIFCHDEDMFNEIDNGDLEFHMHQDTVCDWFFELVNRKDQETEDDDPEVINSTEVTSYINQKWFITMVIFKYITGRPMVISSPDCITPLSAVNNTPLMMG